MLTSATSFGFVQLKTRARRPANQNGRPSRRRIATVHAELGDVMAARQLLAEMRGALAVAVAAPTWQSKVDEFQRVWTFAEEIDRRIASLVSAGLRSHAADIDRALEDVYGQATRAAVRFAEADRVRKGSVVEAAHRFRQATPAAARDAARSS